MPDKLQKEHPWYAKSYDTDSMIKKILPDGKLLTKHYDAEGFFKNIVESIISKPLWVKQAIYIELRDDIKNKSSLELIEALDKNDLLQLYTPVRSVLGHKIFNENDFASNNNVSPEMVNLLSHIDNRKNVIDLCYANQCTLKHFSELIIEAHENGYIENIRSKQIFAIFNYLAGQIDIGQLLVKLNKITPEQLSFANYSISEMNKTFEVSETNTLEEVLIRMNYIDKDRINSLLLLKEASEIKFEKLDDITKPDIDLMQENMDILTIEKARIEAELEAYKPLMESKDRRIKELEQELLEYKKLYQEAQKSSGFFNKL
jgi:hypothetical protein